ncbi:hypothetical protein FA95DRAFT_712606 [Auriscalpium vulgare]|uniref:Uncharacterized protein n=1 Tax=Auriscalpium vulgare TaxID=40419 RepID=A0ACB8RB03_9AGAM|nr:hypothetical protein FA95DRAFT_712606 [Auriscalpium vulgare]
MHVFKCFKKMPFRPAQRSQVTVQDTSPHYDYEEPSQARATLGTSVALLREIGEICGQVPYLKGAAGVLSRIIVISDTLSIDQNQWIEVNNNAKQLISILDEASQFAKDHAWIIPPDLQHILRLWLLTQEHRKNPGPEPPSNDIILEKIILPSNPAISFHWPPPSRPPKIIPARPSIFYGRDSYMITILEMMENKMKLPIRAGILGPGGIGKTTLALEILHHPIVEQIFNERM